MNIRLRPVLCLLPLLALAGCETAPVTSPQPAAVSTPVHAMGPAAAPAVIAPAKATEAVTEAATEAAKRLMDGSQPHEMLRTSAFASFPQFTTENWSGLVLNSKVSTQSLAHTSNFRVLRIEIHPLLDGRIRVWLELGNFSNKPVTPEVACQFTPEDDTKNAKFATMAELGAGKKAVGYFESRLGAPYAYSILARNKR